MFHHNQLGVYRVILADPPWKYRVYDGADSSKHGPAAKHYKTLPLDYIKSLPVSTLAHKDCALFLWATMPCLPEALEVMKSWEFQYKTVAFTWVKLNKNGTPWFGLGHYTRGNAELCLLGTRGRPKRKAKNVRQVILSQRREHSRKPDEQYERIMNLFGGPYIELFARQQYPGWDVWGNQVDLFRTTEGGSMVCTG